MTILGRIGISWTNKPSFNRFMLFLAAGCGCGYFPIAPGTVGSLPGILLFFVFNHFSPISQSIAFVFFILLAVGLADRAERISRIEDPNFVVVDEIVGMWASLFMLWRVDWVVVLLAFLLFRAFDVLKFFPLNLFEGFRGGVGIVVDDLAAGMLVNIILRFLIFGGINL